MDNKADQDRRRTLMASVLARRSAADAQARSVATSNTVAWLSAQVRQLQTALAKQEQAAASLAQRLQAAEEVVEALQEKLGQGGG